MWNRVSGARGRHRGPPREAGAVYSASAHAGEAGDDGAGAGQGGGAESDDAGVRDGVLWGLAGGRVCEWVVGVHGAGAGEVG